MDRNSTSISSSAMELDGGNGHIAKRQKLTNGSSSVVIPLSLHRPGESRVFAPYRTVGLVSPTSVPFTAVPRGKTTFQITTSIGRSLQTYDLARGLNLVFITRPQTPELITASIAWKDVILTAYGGEEASAQRGVWIFKRGKKEAELEWPGHCNENVQAFCVFGSWIVGVCDTKLLVWKSASHELWVELRGISPIAFTRCIASLPTFLNKVIVGRQDGSAEIWNVSSGKLVYTILPPSTAYGAVTAIEPTPALSLVAIAFEQGPLLIHDVKSDQTLIHLKSPAGAAITSISFRTDGQGAGVDGKEAGVMATASSATGDITMWDLNNGGRKSGVLRAAHAQPSKTTPGGTSKIEFLAGQPTLVSSGLDNSLKTWTFDNIPFDPVPRILHERRGHGAPVTRLLFLPSASDGSDDTGKWMLSGSKDQSLWAWSLRRDGQSTEISQGNVQSKAKKQGLLSNNQNSFHDFKCPAITSIACSLNRDGGIGAIPGKHQIWQPAGKGKHVAAEISAMTGWESVLTAHENDKRARTWFWGRKRAGRWAFETKDASNVTSIAMSPCGTFGIVGSQLGGIDMFNMQSGVHRQRFPARLTPMQAKQLRAEVERHGLIEEDDGKRKFYRGQGKHNAPIVGLAVDSLNRTLISASADGKVKFWNFRTGLLQDQLDWTGTTGIIGMKLHRGSDLAALSCTDGCIRVIDISTLKVVRELWPSRIPIVELQSVEFSDFVFSEDGRWISACAGKLLFLWDIPTGHLVDAFNLPSECSSVAFSPTGEFLATATKDSVGVDVWTNRSLYGHVSTRHITHQDLLTIVQSAASKAPTASGEGGENLIANVAHEDANNEDEKVPSFADPEMTEVTRGLISLSLVPRARWQTLLHLDDIRARNKPIEPPKKPEKAPFFLPSLQDRQAQKSEMQANSEATLELETQRTKVLQLARTGTQSDFTKLLHASVATLDYTPLLAHFKSLTPAASDVEIRSLSHENDEFVTFINALTWQLQRKQDFELVSTWMAVFLKVHGDIVVQDDAVRDAIQEYRIAVDGEQKRLRKLSGYIGGMLGYLRAARV